MISKNDHRNIGYLLSEALRFILKRAIHISLCFLIITIEPWRSFSQVRGDKIDSNAIDQYISAKMRMPRIPGLAIAIVKGDQIIYVKGYGKVDPAGRPVKSQTPFIIGSVTKAFTALAVMQLVEAGKVNLDAAVQRYLPWFRVADPVASAKITVRQLLLQTSGLPMIREPQLWTDLDDKALERTVRFLKTAKTNFPPGQSFGYSNANYETLGMIIQTVSGQLYEEYIQKHIFDPLEMQNSFVSQEKALVHGMATGYRWWFGVPIPVTFHYNRSELPAGYIISSAEDMGHFLIAQMNEGCYRNNSVLSPNGVAATHYEPAPNTYAMGWESFQINGHTLINHDGGAANFESSIFFDPEERVGVFVVANVMCALDAFSSPHGSDPLDGVTVRAMAQHILNMVTNSAHENEGRGIRQLYIIFNLVVLMLTILLVLSIIQISKRYRKLKQRGIAARSDFIWRISFIASLHFIWPLFVLYLVLNVLLWKVFVMLQPDLTYWLEVVAMTVFLKGLVEMALAWHVFRQGRHSEHLV